MNPTCPEPSCGLEASQVTTREINATTHELTAVCKRGHLWTTKWFAERSA
ncbi:MAG TPA: hypothetical protein VFQ11_10890 [Nocardioidaceae bacterium]|nr:hypothetical protein [Nocardioidaceae bacterium]